jgi:LacI family transcriptional regulator
MPNVMILLEMSNKINRDRIQGILRYERLYGPWRLHIVEGKRFEQPSRDLKSLGIDGVIAGTTLTELLEPIMRARVPTVLFDPLDPSAAKAYPQFRYSTMCCDSLSVGRMGAEYLLEQGFTQFAFVGDIWDSNWALKRRDGFVKRLSKEGLACHVYESPSEVARNDWGVEQKGMASWLAKLPKPIGLMAANDVRGRQVLDTCQMAGISVPDQVAVLGVDNDELICATTNPPMTSILRDTEGSGYCAAQMLDRLMRGRSRKKEAVLYGPLRVVGRQSTEKLQFVDRLAVKAVEFIRINSGIGMNVTDVVKHLKVSRRLAELRFRQAVGHSIHDELQNARLAQVRRLLRETDLSVSEITDHCGYESESYLGLVFRKQFNMTMRQFRKSARNYPSGADVAGVQGARHKEGV